MLFGNKLLGYVDPLSLAVPHEGSPILALGGHSWRVASIDWACDRVYVEPAAEKGVSRWLGGSRGVSRVIAMQVREIIESPPSLDSTMLTRRASQHLEALRDVQKDTLIDAPIRLPDGSYEWWTYAGLAHNTLLAAHITGAGGTYSALGSYSFRFQISVTALEDLGGWHLIREFTPHLKFTRALSGQVRLYVADRSFDQNVLRAYCRECLVN